MPKTPQMPPRPKPIEIEGQVPAPEEPEPEPPKPAVHRPTPAPRTEPAVAEPAPAQPKPAEPVPQLAPMMNEAEARAYNVAIDSALATTDRNLTTVRNRRNLNIKQRNMMQQAETFARQAREARQTDPVAARSLAERAAQLSQELIALLR